MITKLRTSFRPSVRCIGLIMLGLSLCTGIFGYILLHSTFDLLTFIEDFYANISAELGSIAITVIVIDQLQRRREQRERENEEKARLVREAGSRDYSTATSAIQQLREKGWLTGDSGVLRGAKLECADLHTENLNNANLRGAVLAGANLAGAGLCGAELQMSSLQFANLNLAYFWKSTSPQLNTNLYGVDLRSATLQGTDFTSCNLEKANLTGARAQAAIFTHANLKDTRLRNANLQDANFHLTNLEGADLQFSHLEGANLRDANLRGAKLTGVRYDSWTELPDHKDDNHAFWDNTDMRRYTDPAHPDFWQPEWVKNAQVDGAV